MSRERFEKLFPVPENVSWHHVDCAYRCTLLGVPGMTTSIKMEAEYLNGAWSGYQAGEASRQPEIDELVEALEVALAAMDHMGDTLNAMGAVTDEDKPFFEAFHKCRALIATHKGGSMTQRKDGGPAFPVSAEVAAFQQMTGGISGMTLRDFFAAKIMQGLVANPEDKGDAEDKARWAYKAADAMLAERGKGQ